MSSNKFNPNYKRDLLAEQLFLNYLSKTEPFSTISGDVICDISLRCISYASTFMGVIHPAPEELPAAEADEVDNYPVLDGEF